MAPEKVAVVVAACCLAIVGCQTPAGPSAAAAVTDGYVPHASYPYSDTYGTGPVEAYRETAGVSYGEPPSTSLQFMETSLKLLAKTGLFLVGGAIFVFLGLLFSFSLCSITPLCTFEFNSWNSDAKVKALVTPANIARAFDMYKVAVGKYGDMNGRGK